MATGKVTKKKKKSVDANACSAPLVGKVKHLLPPALDLGPPKALAKVTPVADSGSDDDGPPDEVTNLQAPLSSPVIDESRSETLLHKKGSSLSSAESPRWESRGEWGASGRTQLWQNAETTTANTHWWQNEENEQLLAVAREQDAKRRQARKKEGTKVEKDGFIIASAQGGLEGQPGLASANAFLTDELFAGRKRKRSRLDKYDRPSLFRGKAGMHCVPKLHGKK
eukprot:TRINITY_DN317_c0_g1_i1.p2 TRINITY_DN317_c0_g1~~TRINITY_DN317_c0_g1_i1.p2  ORF type:complete len:248 (-),score=45.88 TRINITY_DN317_c0_g1_i1:80-754(-)